MVLSPSFFFLGRAFADNTALVENGALELSGPGSFKVALADVDSLELINALPETAGTGGFSLGLIKKGNFVRKSDQRSIRLVKNNDEAFIYLRAEGEEYYFSLASAAATKEMYQTLKSQRGYGQYTQKKMPLLQNWKRGLRLTINLFFYTRTWPVPYT